MNWRIALPACWLLASMACTSSSPPAAPPIVEPRFQRELAASGFFDRLGR